MAAMSIFFIVIIVIIASKARLATEGSGSVTAAVRARGVLCQDRPPLVLALREALKAMSRADLIGNGKQQLIPTFQPATDGGYQSERRKNSTPVAGRLLTQHTGLPPRVMGAAPAVKSRRTRPGKS